MAHAATRSVSTSQTSSGTFDENNSAGQAPGGLMIYLTECTPICDLLLFSFAGYAKPVVEEKDLRYSLEDNLKPGEDRFDRMEHC
jgi:hypothetical protein